MGSIWEPERDIFGAIMTPERRPHNWVEHKSPRCAECMTCGKVIGSEPGVSMLIPFAGCTAIEVDRRGEGNSDG